MLRDWLDIGDGDLQLWHSLHDEAVLSRLSKRAQNVLLANFPPTATVLDIRSMSDRAIKALPNAHYKTLWELRDRLGRHLPAAAAEAPVERGVNPDRHT